MFWWKMTVAAIMLVGGIIWAWSAASSTEAVYGYYFALAGGALGAWWLIKRFVFKIEDYQPPGRS
jgi:hypothetical protein